METEHSEFRAEGSTGGMPSTPPRRQSLSSNGGSDVSDRNLQQTPKRVSISKASSLTVALSGGSPKPRSGSLRRRSNSPLFATFKDSFVVIDDGDICFQKSEDDFESREVYSILAVKEIRLASSGSSQFQVRLAENAPLPAVSAGNSSSSSLLSTLADFGGGLSKGKLVTLKASSNREALDWVACIKHELRNQVLVCKSMFFTLQAEGRQERAEPLFEQMVELLRVIHDGKEHFEVAETLRTYGKWLESQGRHDEALNIKRQAKAIKRRCEEGLDSSLARSPSLNGETSYPRSPRLPPLGKSNRLNLAE